MQLCYFEKHKYIIKINYEFHINIKIKQTKKFVLFILRHYFYYKLIFITLKK
jgi:hypothetical protein